MRWAASRLMRVLTHEVFQCEPHSWRVLCRRLADTMRQCSGERWEMREMRDERWRWNVSTETLWSRLSYIIVSLQNVAPHIQMSNNVFVSRPIFHISTLICITVLFYHFEFTFSLLINPIIWKTCILRLNMVYYNLHYNLCWNRS